MTVEHFIAEIQGYYGGQYQAGQLKYVGSWLSRKRPEALPFIMSELFKQYSARFKVLPGIAELEAAAKEVRAHRAFEIPKNQMELPKERDATPEEVEALFKNLEAEMTKKMQEKKA